VVLRIAIQVKPLGVLPLTGLVFSFRWIHQIGQKMGGIGKTLLVLVAIGAFYAAHVVDRPEDLRAKLSPGNEVVMYSLTTCGFCARTRAFLTDSGIPFTERFLDTDPEGEREFFEILTANGAPSGGVGTPSLVVNDTLLLNNPPFDVIKKHLRLNGT
jgi:glutaredoxin